MGALVIVATPIGNLADITPRAVEALRNADLIACEDTRHTLKLLNHLAIQKPLVSYHDFNEEKRAEELGAKIASGATIALVSDAGTPGISDPGYRLVRYCRDHNLTVTPVPGPNAAVTALAASGLPSDQFFFGGFLPSKRAARLESLQKLRQLSATLVFYEAPHRILEMIADLAEVLGDRETCVARELTKIHEEFLVGTLNGVQSRIKPMGEFVVVVRGSTEKSETPLTKPKTREEALKILGMSRNELYDLFFKKDK